MFALCFLSDKAGLCACSHLKTPITLCGRGEVAKNLCPHTASTTTTGLWAIHLTDGPLARLLSGNKVKSSRAEW